MSKYGLVLEGGGMRGAYTAGALSWMIDNNVTFDYGVGISAGAINLCSYELKDKKFLYDIAVKYMSDKRNVGIIPLIKERRYVGYGYMFDELLYKNLKYDTKPLVENKVNMEIGIYDLNECKTKFYRPESFDDKLKMLKAACTLPIAGNIVDFNGCRYLDGGIKIMIPIERSIEQGNDKNFVIITKPAGYVRKAAGKFMQWLMKFNYPKYPNLVHDYINRHLSYNSQMKLIEHEVTKGNCFLLRPSINIPVKRFSGDPENLKKLYELGYQDMENQKEAIFKFLGK